MTSFPTSKIELHQWVNSIMLVVIGFFAVQTYNTISNDHERIANHETRITVLERTGKSGKDLGLLPMVEAILPKNVFLEEAGCE